MIKMTEARNARRAWDEPTTEKFIKAFKRGKTVEELMDQFGRTRPAIISKLNAEGYYVGRKKKDTGKVVKSRVVNESNGNWFWLKIKKVFE